MALQTFGYSTLAPILPMSLTSSSTSLNTTNTIVSQIFQCGKSGNISEVHVRPGTVTSSQSLTVGIQLLDSSGNPDGSFIGASGTIASVSSNTWATCTLGSVAAVTRGVQYAIVIQWTSTQGNISWTRYQTNSTLQSFDDLTYFDSFASPTWTKVAGSMLCSLRYDDNAYYAQSPGIMPGVQNWADFNNGTTPDEKGNVFTLPYPAKCSGVAFVGRWAAGATAEVSLYDGTTELEGSASMDGDSGTPVDGVKYIFFPTDVDLSASTAYRVVLRPTSATSVRVLGCDVENSASMGMLPGGTSVYSTSRTDSGSWTDVNTTRYFIYPILTAYSDGVGSGGSGGSGGMNRGFVKFGS